VKEKRGLIMVYTGDGKGKTTAALGQAFRAAGHGFKVLVINFMKGRDYGEAKAASYLPDFEVIKAGTGKFVDPDNPGEEDLRLAAEGLARARKAALEGDCDLVVLDEINVAVSFNLVSFRDVLDLVKNKRPEVTLILTGRDAPPEFLEMADLVSEVKEVKHHYMSGVKAQKGIEF